MEVPHPNLVIVRVSDHKNVVGIPYSKLVVAEIWNPINVSDPNLVVRKVKDLV